MAVVFSDLHTESGLKAFDAFLSGKSYLSGTQLTEYDVKAFAAVSKKPSSDLYPNACKWYEAVSSKLASSSPGKAFGVRIGGQAAVAAAPASEAKMDGLVNHFVEEYRALAYHYPRELCSFVNDYRVSWSLAYQFGTGVSQYEGIFRLIMILPLCCREWAHWVSARYHVLDPVARRRVTHFSPFFEIVFSQLNRFGIPPPGPFEDDPQFPRIDLPWDLPGIRFVVPTQVQPRGITSPVAIAPTLPLEAELGPVIAEVDIVMAAGEDVEEVVDPPEAAIDPPLPPPPPAQIGPQDGGSP